MMRRGQALSFRTGSERGTGRKNRENGGEKTGGKNREKRQQEKDNRYLMSLKDLCTLDILPDIIEAGVYSLKIEGRNEKSPVYGWCGQCVPQVCRSVFGQGTGGLSDIR